jgi:hypothetical protein
MTTTNPILTGMIVLFEGGWYRVTKATKNKVNLGAAWGGRVYHKGIDITLVQEDGNAFYENWRKSDSYQCM